MRLVQQAAWGILAAILSLFVGVCSADEAMLGKVVGITDGDTLVLLGEDKQQHKIRLAGIDAPEKGQPFGDRSKESLAGLAFGQLAKADCTKRDRYRRLVCTIWVNEVDVNLEQVRGGFAWHYKKYAGEQRERERVAYAQAESDARTAGIGLWASGDQVSPWEWRATKRMRVQPADGGLSLH